ncbi:hypothetical protein T02_14509 [Trichinella nativa]|uniref:Uncharacterized protein n=1 Tax=Trichinella nativa TaxID=6335 RepID=A0A0V1KIV1_9BILA|nr:hypothetical protein T02_14509 [Trichinella nativa]
MREQVGAAEEWLRQKCQGSRKLSLLEAKAE